MNKWHLILIALGVATYLYNFRPPCYETISVPSGPPNSPILVNKCNGDTYMLLRNPSPKKDNQLTADFYYGWYRIERYGIENSVAGLEKNAR